LIGLIGLIRLIGLIGLIGWIGFIGFIGWIGLIGLAIEVNTRGLRKGFDAEWRFLILFYSESS
jgi:hypothetical protein